MTDYIISAEKNGVKAFYGTKDMLIKDLGFKDEKEFEAFLFANRKELAIIVSKTINKELKIIDSMESADFEKLLKLAMDSYNEFILDVKKLIH